MKQKLIALFLIIMMVASLFAAIGTTTTTKVDALTATTTTITASKIHPVVGESVTFTVTLKAGTTGLSKTVTICHFLNGVRYSDGTHNTVNGVYKFTQAVGSVGSRLYIAKFYGDSKYAVSSSSVIVYVQPIPTTTTLTVSKTNPVIGQSVTFTATLKRWNPATTSYVALPSKWVTIWHYAGGVRANDFSKQTDVYGRITWSKSWTAAVSVIYFASFWGDSVYAKSGAGVTVTVQKIPTTLTLSIPSWWHGTGTLVEGMLTDQNGHALRPDPTVQLYMGTSATNFWRYETEQTDDTGYYQTLLSQYVITVYIQAKFIGDSTYAASTSDIVSIPPAS